MLTFTCVVGEHKLNSIVTTTFDKEVFPAIKMGNFEAASSTMKSPEGESCMLNLVSKFEEFLVKIESLKMVARNFEVTTEILKARTAEQMKLFMKRIENFEAFNQIDSVCLVEIEARLN
ncbi:hypothetical protein MA16_Dca021598 [Dendrobium catenatum]|uniref:Uncharacterized protein n=1 Tax=Dendrobium catenatum TaxID=906689 RepID=A0A2I0WZJ6_9ASPA|nr:hypothetical protein MA16_Dca021598 [Dendrobium catenatum]